jgi:hypothetical protein
MYLYLHAVSCHRLASPSSAQSPLCLVPVGNSLCVCVILGYRRGVTSSSRRAGQPLGCLRTQHDSRAHAVQNPYSQHFLSASIRGRWSVSLLRYSVRQIGRKPIVCLIVNPLLSTVCLFFEGLRATSISHKRMRLDQVVLVGVPTCMVQQVSVACDVWTRNTEADSTTTICGYVSL